MRKAGFALLILCLGAAQASADVDCVKAECEGKGRTCVETLHVTCEACRKAANEKCNTVQLAEKFNCPTLGKDRQLKDPGAWLCRY
ncbi:hypothetical protein [Taklimakanibacter lacteus]|uniref:hypothetical protein n=1 Tax=Taklimakanibacter lacteus TaxID=2268456 RepID=UPI0013C4BD0E